MSGKKKAIVNSLFARFASFMVGIIICLGSMWLTCRHIVLNDTMPTFAGQWYFNAETLFVLAKIVVGGLGCTMAQVLGRIVHRYTGETKYLALYWAATTLSVIVSITTFYSGNEIGAEQAKYTSHKYQTLLAQKESHAEHLNALKKDFNAYLDGEFLRLKRKHWYTVAESQKTEKLTKIKEASEKLDDIYTKLMEYQDAEGGGTVSANSTYVKMVDDFVTLFDFNPLLAKKLVILLNFSILIAFSLIPDLAGPFLVAFGIVGTKGVSKTKETPGNDLMKRLWHAASNQPLLPDVEDKELAKLRNKAFSKLKSHELKALLKDAKNIVKVIPTLKTRIFLEAAPDSGKTTLMQMLIKEAMAKGEMLPNNSKLFIFDLQDEEKGKWPAWAKVFGQNQSIPSIKKGFDELKVLKEQGKQKDHVFILVDEGMEMAKMYEDYYKEPLGNEYSWIISFARQKGFSLFFSTVVGTGKAVGTEGLASIKDAYAYKINLLYHPVSNIRCALLKIGGMEADYYNIPNCKNLNQTIQPSFRTKLNEKIGGTMQLVRQVKQAGTHLRDIVPVDSEPNVPEEDYVVFQDTGTANRTTPVPPVPAEYIKENRQERTNIVPLVRKTVPPNRTSTEEARTTLKKSVPPWVKNAYQNISGQQERTILDMANEGVSHNNIIKQIFGTTPTPKYRKWLKAVLWMNGVE